MVWLRLKGGPMTDDKIGIVMASVTYLGPVFS
jgi:hypothetical protein